MYGWCISWRVECVLSFPVSSLVKNHVQAIFKQFQRNFVGVFVLYKSTKQRPPNLVIPHFCFNLESCWRYFYSIWCCESCFCIKRQHLCFGQKSNSSPESLGLCAATTIPLCLPIIVVLCFPSTDLFTQCFPYEAVNGKIYHL